MWPREVKILSQHCAMQAHPMLEKLCGGSMLVYCGVLSLRKKKAGRDMLWPHSPSLFAMFQTSSAMCPP